jgi:hypothetical protein
MESAVHALPAVLCGIVKMVAVRDGQIHEGQQGDLEEHDVVTTDSPQEFLPDQYKDVD